MADYFTSDHFNLLNKWKGQKRDESNPEQSRAYEDLKKAYEVTEAWANEFKARIFPTGIVKIRKRPTSQANSFVHYNWARIYPSSEAPDVLAYTVGIDAEAGFVVKIDTVQADPALRARYERVRGAFNDQSPIVAILPTADGLSKSFAELVEWSVAAIHGFKLRYDDVAAKLQLSKTLSDEDLLKHFDEKPVFKTFRASWSSHDKVLFCRLARTIHDAGLDWWHMGKGIQVRFGRKNPRSERAVGVLGVIRGMRARRLTWTRDVGVMSKSNQEPLTNDLIAKIEVALSADRELLNDWLLLDTERPGLWPDQLREDPEVPDDDTDDEVSPADNVVRQPFNRIYYGPPGTGKTYKLTKLLRRDYEQSMNQVSAEEWRSQFIASRIATLTWWEGAAAAIHDLGGTAKVGQLFDHPFIQAIAAIKGRNQNVRQTIWGTLQHHTVEESKTVNTKQRLAPAVFDKTSESVWMFAGDWQDACADLITLVKEYNAGPQASGNVERYSFVTFHQSYGYEEFVEGLRPVLDGDSGSGDVQYEIRAGVFKDLCRRARLAPEPIEVFNFPKNSGMRLWVLPFCLNNRQLMLPLSQQLNAVFSKGRPNDRQAFSANALSV